MKFVSPTEAWYQIYSSDNMFFTAEDLGIVGRAPTTGELVYNYLTHIDEVVCTITEFVVEESVSTLAEVSEPQAA